MKPLLESIDTRFGTASKHAFLGEYTAIHRHSFWNELLVPRPVTRRELGFSIHICLSFQGSINPPAQPLDWGLLLAPLTPVTGQLGGDSLFHRQSSYDIDKTSFQPHYLKIFSLRYQIESQLHRLAMVLPIRLEQKAKPSPISTQQMNWQ